MFFLIVFILYYFHLSAGNGCWVVNHCSVNEHGEVRKVAHEHQTNNSSDGKDRLSEFNCLFTLLGGCVVTCILLMLQ